MSQRSVYFLGWFAVTAAATTVGLGTVSVVRAAVGEPETVVTLSDSEPEVVGAAPSASPRPVASPDPTLAPTSGPTPTSTPTPTARSVFRSLVSPGGSVLARCTGGLVYVVSAAPHQGYQVEIEDRVGAQAKVAFRGNQKFQVQVRCERGTPDQTVELESAGVDSDAGFDPPEPVERVRSEN